MESLRMGSTHHTGPFRAPATGQHAQFGVGLPDDMEQYLRSMHSRHRQAASTTRSSNSLASPFTTGAK